MINGVINVYKEPGFTSHDVVAKLRGITKQKKIGHTGTLDPDAEGVLPVCMGAATRICDLLTDEIKEYEAVMLFGVVTDTQDLSGTVIEEHREAAAALTEEEAVNAVMSFKGDISQIPPMYSAIKQNGKKLYELARAGVEVERTPRLIRIYDIVIMDISLPELTMRVKCSKGTYIRTLCHDIGAKAGCGASMKHLTRTRVGRFDVDEAVRIDRIEQLTKEDRLGEVTMSLTEFFGDLPAGIPDPGGEKKASNGNMLSLRDFKGLTVKDNEEIRVMRDDGFLYGIYRYTASDGMLRPVKMFLCEGT